jgi:hypothetical protein
MVFRELVKAFTKSVGCWVNQADLIVVTAADGKMLVRPFDSACPASCKASFGIPARASKTNHMDCSLPFSRVRVPCRQFQRRQGNGCSIAGSPLDMVSKASEPSEIVSRGTPT